MSGKSIKDQDYFLPCPFCGDSELEIIESEFEDNQEGEGLTVYCDCGAQGPASKTEDEAILKWNSRFRS
jgi:Lar family restriction alleviation protein